MKVFSILLYIIVTTVSSYAQNTGSKVVPRRDVKPSKEDKHESRIIPGAERLDQYVAMLKGKSVGIFANQTSMVGHVHLVDTLKKLGINIKVIFGPEHGFRGTASAGEKIDNAIDKNTGVPVVSLYGEKRKPSASDVKDVDVMVFDIQDVGIRYYTIISSLEEYIGSAIENKKPLIILDRPNPNGFYVDGPVLEKKFKSFIGMQPVPIVYGMTIAEYAKMIIGERWLAPEIIAKLPATSVQNDMNNKATGFNLTIIPCANYTHKSRYVPPVKPSPNLPDIQSIYLYSSTCFFEGTVLSEGRGTDKPFQVFGDPLLPHDLFSFTPTSNEGAKSSKHYGEVCYGWNLSGTPEEVYQKVNRRVQLKWLLEAYRLFPDKNNFFLKPKKENAQPAIYFFSKLAGNDELMQQVITGKSEAEIRKSWEPKLEKFRGIRRKYLIYED